MGAWHYHQQLIIFSSKETTGKEENIKITQKYISSLLSGKNYKDENFPVSSFLIDKKLQQIIRVFYFYARTADDIADHASIKKKEKLRILNFFDSCLKNKKRSEVSVVNNLISYFDEYKFSKKYSRDLLVAFKLDATKKRYKDWSELLHYCKFSANPVGRFVINTTYSQKRKKINERKILHASDMLCTALQIINHIQDCKDDFRNLDRVYIPENFLKKHQLNANILTKKSSCQNFDKMKIVNFNHFYQSSENTAIVAGTIMSIQEKKSAKGTPFAIVKFSDLESEFELFLFSDLLVLNRDKLKAANSFILTLQKDSFNQDNISRRINIKKLISLNDFTKKEYDKVTIELKNQSNLDDLQNLLKEDGNTKIEIKIRKTSKVYTFALKNLRKFNVGTFNHIKDKEYVEKISF